MHTSSQQPLQPSAPGGAGVDRSASFGVMLHHLHGAGHAAGQGSISGEQLRQIIALLGRERFVPAAEWLRLATSDALRGELCLTFDDNLRCQFDIAAPILRELRLTGMFFVATAVLQGQLLRTELYRAFRARHFATPGDFYRAFGAVVNGSPLRARVTAALARFDPQTYLRDFPFYTEEDRRFRFMRDELLTPDEYQRLMDEMVRQHGVQLKALAVDLWMNDDCLLNLHAEGHVIGLHSHTHPTRLAELTMSEQRREYRANHAYLTSLLGAPPIVAAHPCNSYNAATLRVLGDLGVRVAFRSNMAQRSYGPLEHPREDHANLLAAS